MNLLLHAISKHTVNHLVTRNQTLALECRADNEGFEVVTVTGHIQLIAIESGRDEFLNQFWGHDAILRLTQRGSV